MLKHEYTLICEHARPEAGGKWIIIGLTNGIGTPAIPFPLPMLTFFHLMTADAAGHYKFTARLSELITGKTLAQAQGLIQVGPVATAAPVNLAVALPNLQIAAFGTYIWSLEIAGQEQEPFVTQFNVSHVPQQFRIAPPPPFPQR